MYPNNGFQNNNYNGNMFNNTTGMSGQNGIPQFLGQQVYRQDPNVKVNPNQNTGNFQSAPQAGMPSFLQDINRPNNAAFAKPDSFNGGDIMQSSSSLQPQNHYPENTNHMDPNINYTQNYQGYAITQPQNISMMPMANYQMPLQQQYIQMGQPHQQQMQPMLNQNYAIPQNYNQQYMISQMPVYQQAMQPNLLNNLQPNFPMAKNNNNTPKNNNQNSKFKKGKPNKNQKPNVKFANKDHKNINSSQEKIIYDKEG